MKQRSCRINEQGSDGEEVSHEEQQHQTDIASKNMAAKQQKATESRKEVQKVSEGSTSQKHNIRSEQEATNNRKRLWRLAEMTKTESFKINHEVANVTRSREICVQPQPAESFAVSWYEGQVVTGIEQATVESQNSAMAKLTAATKLQVSSDSQTSPHLRSSTACPVDPCLRANSGKQDGRDFNDQGGERGRRPISFRSCVEDSEHTDQKAAQVVSAPSGPLDDVKTKLVVTGRRWTGTEQGGTDSCASGSEEGRDNRRFENPAIRVSRMRRPRRCPS